MGDLKLNVQIICPKFNSEAKDCYHEWGEFQMGCQNIFDRTYSAMDKAERSATVLNWMGWDALKITQTLHDDDQKKLKKDVTQLLTFFKSRFKSEANTILAGFQFPQMSIENLHQMTLWVHFIQRQKNVVMQMPLDKYCEQFTVMIDDMKMQDELLVKLSDTSTPEDTLEITCKNRSPEATKVCYIARA